MSLQVNEIFSGIQGEGYFIGEQSIFVRLSGCNLNCEWCDTKYAQEEEGKEWDVHELAVKIIEIGSKKGIDSIVITGGEPLLQSKGLKELFEILSNRLKITIETHGAYPIPEDLIKDKKYSIFFSISPKLSNSGTKYDKKMLDRNMKSLSEMGFYNYQLKFVIDTNNIEEDVDETMHLMSEIILPEYLTIIYQPKAESNDTTTDLINKTRKLTDYFIENSHSVVYDIRVLPQLHTILYGNERGY